MVSAQDFIRSVDNDLMEKDVLLQDANRLAVLRDLEIVDTPAELAYDDIAALASACCDSLVAAVNFVDGAGHWTKAIVGVEGGQGARVPADLSFCVETVCTNGGVLSIPDMKISERWMAHPFVANSPLLRFYHGAAISVFGEPVGVVCVFGNEPKELTDRQRLSLVALARQTSAQLELRKQNAQLLELSATDPLTGLANRRLLLDCLNREIATSRRSGASIGVLYCDVDDFKDVNDRWGHDTGDRVLCQIAAGLRAATREIDTAARISGDEFVVVCPGIQEPGDLEKIAERISRVLNVVSSLDDGLAIPHLSIGLAILQDGETASDVLRRADEAMYLRKGKGSGARREA